MEISKEEIYQKVNETKAKISALRDQLKGEVSDLFYSMSKSLFDKHPELKSFGWRQYTPYFNDGEECTFRSYHTDPNINGFNDDWGEEGEEGDLNLLEMAHDSVWEDVDGSYKNVPKTPDANAKEIVDKLKFFLNSFDDEDMKEMFGDHIEVLVDRNGVHIETIDHD